MRVITDYLESGRPTDSSSIRGQSVREDRLPDDTQGPTFTCCPVLRDRSASTRTGRDIEPTEAPGSDRVSSTGPLHEFI